ncbi:hypothetical protein DFR67_104179 [Williamsia limnetica]|jgi:hypothetical protein|uniref:Uncharacterized protein n=1 Tax=Williamsia limnetica TaxID=882452 RepID=A0A318RPN3_WILLI|nr:hypothetical protein [Williamsia limnetica]PYE18600.1 hypothetical protein DFR67_104179 [Williamsia limnetica]
MTNTTRRTLNRIGAGCLGIAATAAIGFGVAGAANAGTVPVTHPGEPSIAMTISNNTNQTEYLVGNESSSGGWVNGPKDTLAPGESETIVAVAGSENILETDVEYQIGATGPVATYRVVDSQMDGASTFGSGINGDGSTNYVLIPGIQSAFPNANATFTLK